MQRKVIKKEVRDYLIIFFVSIVFAYLTCPGCFTRFEPAFKNAFYSFLAWILLWKGNEYIADFLNKKISWVRQTKLRFILGMVFMIVYTVIILFLIQYFFYIIGYSSSKFGSVSNYLLSIGITIFISLLVHSVAFLKSWRQAEIDNEKLKNEQLSSQYEALKSQVNPHFLFNSLNALSSLVHEDPDQAVRFIQQLSRVYRYVLDNRGKEIVSLGTEMNFVESYLFLQKIRFGQNLQFIIKTGDDKNLWVAPLSVQMLIENAIKHNIISSEQPLLITVYIDEEGYLVTKNNLQLKNIISESSGIGLENIKGRYLYFTKKQLKIERTQKEFIVKLPLINAGQDTV